jgi:hypothetical protein
MGKSSSYGLGYLIGIVVVLVIVFYLIVYVILPVTIVILGSIGIAGVTSGIGVSARNCQQLLVEAHKVER